VDVSLRNTRSSLSGNGPRSAAPTVAGKALDIAKAKTLAATATAAALANKLGLGLPKTITALLTSITRFIARTRYLPRDEAAAIAGAAADAAMDQVIRICCETLDASIAPAVDAALGHSYKRSLARIAGTAAAAATAAAASASASIAAPSDQETSPLDQYDASHRRGSSGVADTKQIDGSAVPDTDNMPIPRQGNIIGVSHLVSGLYRTVVGAAHAAKSSVSSMSSKPTDSNIVPSPALDTPSPAVSGDAKEREIGDEQLDEESDVMESDQSPALQDSSRTEMLADSRLDISTIFGKLAAIHPCFVPKLFTGPWRAALALCARMLSLADGLLFNLELMLPPPASVANTPTFPQPLLSFGRFRTSTVLRSLGFALVRVFTAAALPFLAGICLWDHGGDDIVVDIDIAASSAEDALHQLAVLVVRELICCWLGVI
jgi:hypothetical protein